MMDGLELTAATPTVHSRTPHLLTVTCSLY